MALRVMDPYSGFLATYQSPRTKYAYLNNLKKLHYHLGRIGKTSPLLATKADLAGFFSTLQAYSQTYQINIRATVREFYSYLKSLGLITENISDVLDMFRLKEPKRVSRAQSAEDLERLVKSLKYTTHRDLKISCVVLLGFHGGLRVSEIVGLRLENVDFENKLLKVVGKGNNERRVRMSDTLKAALYQLYGEHKSKFGLFLPPYLFPSPSNDQKPLVPAQIQNLLKKACLRAGLKPLSIHDLRHSGATTLHRSGAGIESIQKFLGHANIQTTTRYILNDPQIAFDAVDRAFNNP